MTELTAVEVKQLASLVASIRQIKDAELTYAEIDWDTVSIEIPFETFESKVSGSVRFCEDGEIRLILNG